MRLPKALLAGLAGLAAAGLAGCSNSGPSHPSSHSPGQPGASSPAPAPSETGATEPHAKSGARQAAVRYDHLYVAGHYAASWDMLTPVVRKQVPRALWIRVHHGCRPARAARTITAITVFGNAAIVSEAVALGPPRHRRGEEVFSYLRGRWGYSPNDLSIYHHGSASADITAARAAGFCATWKSF